MILFIGYWIAGLISAIIFFRHIRQEMDVTLLDLLVTILIVFFGYFGLVWFSFPLIGKLQDIVIFKQK